MTPEAAHAAIERAKQTYAIPAQEETRRAEEETKRAQEETKRSRHELLKHCAIGFCVVVGVIAMAAVPSVNAWAVAMAISVLGGTAYASDVLKQLIKKSGGQ